jgi:hypothetical protein
MGKNLKGKELGAGIVQKWFQRLSRLCEKLL